MVKNSGPVDFLALQTFPGPSQAKQVWYVTPGLYERLVQRYTNS